MEIGGRDPAAAPDRRRLVQHEPLVVVHATRVVLGAEVTGCDEERAERRGGVGLREGQEEDAGVGAARGRRLYRVHLLPVDGQRHGDRAVVGSGGVLVAGQPHRVLVLVQLDRR